jgi:hypothetical protein
MAIRIKLTDNPRIRIRDTSTPRASVSPELVAKALGAEPTEFALDSTLDPNTVHLQQIEMFNRLRLTNVLVTTTEEYFNSHPNPALEVKWKQRCEEVVHSGPSGITFHEVYQVLA